MTSRTYQKIKKFLVAEDGPTIVEYAVLLALLAGMMIASLWYVREQTFGLSNDIVTGLDNALDY